MTWDRIVNAVVAPRGPHAIYLGLELAELRAVGQLAALEAERTWRADGGTALSTWVWQHVQGAVTKTVYRACREIADDTVGEAIEDGEPDAEVLAILRQALVLLQAQLDPDEFRLMWAIYVLGFTPSELADLRGVDSSVIRQRLFRARKKAVTILSLAA